MTYSITLSGEDLSNKEKMKDFQAVMAEAQSEMIRHCETEAEKLGVTLDCMLDIVYLRGRSRWTQELEDLLIESHKAGHRPNMNGFGVGYVREQHEN